jgi:hypothetical protein
MSGELTKGIGQCLVVQPVFFLEEGRVGTSCSPNFFSHRLILGLSLLVSHLIM